jgi:hypothetical protein
VVSPVQAQCGAGYSTSLRQDGQAGVRIFMIDTEADNLPALHFFRARGFGSPQQHIYMTYNPAATELQKEKKRGLKGKKNGSTHKRGA